VRSARTTAGDGAPAGGSPFNVAVTVGRLGAQAGFLGSISTEFFESRQLEALRERNVDTQLVSRLERPSTLAFVNRDSVEPEYTF
jgi:fructokinase